MKTCARILTLACLALLLPGLAFGQAPKGIRVRKNGHLFVYVPQRSGYAVWRDGKKFDDLKKMQTDSRGAYQLIDSHGNVVYSWSPPPPDTSRDKDDKEDGFSWKKDGSLK